ncbi:hypothetical protein GLOIN_2v1761175 [Rhizophagus irregularis DAOM 181602=DAOM 197198]|uniref:Uncharacterized protein n=1 Tax=Rhizophagus irregularis (strain DAOM 181602 / DAOM 197198 / MUCL 43194) TaxID=747089 RepID=A0A2H5TNH5_RHIID|nr:hypothetical protein GLOIN_2v1761175 [Rhizophagus irregularis DAOM 181602=DAOM 197198]POG83158.1 hypothetical protein GLOIN_2v1761175 [Rhizophagus irregularis DAOM 181602=DAOM 197198]GBC44106.1 hypothetical protein GLOIN_2v1761175 [Rhizophagus irregularis DAOM 181602=DAOM 197198]|eukprot:XP_025190024.1 hypothetical protein GLOIN_2v1761175 [Rhizophagus irregularis DAOM 181602=DAOM 197198]
MIIIGTSTGESVHIHGIGKKKNAPKINLNTLKENEDEIKRRIPIRLLQILDFENNEQINEQINEQTNTTTVPSQTLSLFSIQTIFKLYKIKINDSILTPEECSQMGCNLARDLKKTCKEFRDFQALESPNSLNEYQ